MRNAYCLCLILCVSADGALAQGGRTTPSFEKTNHVAIQRLASPDMPMLQVTSSAFRDGQPLPADFTAYGKGQTPPLTWSSGPTGTQSYVVIVEDPAGHEPMPILQWLAYDIPADTTALPEGFHAEAGKAKSNACEGRNTRGSVGYLGPRPTPGERAHPYHFQVFALDTKVNLPAGAEIEDVTAAMQGHILAAGEVVATFRAPAGH